MANEKRLIDANVLIDEIDGIYKRHYINSSYQFIHDFFRAVFRKIHKAPTVEVVHGQWLDGCAIHNGKEVYKSIDCSHCEEVFKIESHDREYWKARFKVCPFCGAVMDGERKDNG